MGSIEKIYKLHQLFKERRTPVSLNEIQEELECSERHAYRLVNEELRDKFGAPIELNTERGGYYYNTKQQDNYELPGVWMSQAELEGLSMAHFILERVQAGLLNTDIQKLVQRIQKILANKKIGGSQNLTERIHILSMGRRTYNDAAYKAVINSINKQQQLQVVYYSKSNNETKTRTISPQQLVFYRDNWYLDAYCHTANELRIFALDGIQQVTASQHAAHQIPPEKLHRHYATAYGLFAGEATRTAVLKFNAYRARWVAQEQWHPDQKGTQLADGSYELHLPYHHATELIMDILKYGAEVEVISPPDLRAAVAEKLRAAEKIYAT
ncbi:MAG: WYL domain-containing transcriptional regulator [Gammaproteobacteria bacterium]|nr:WYL domain-containing transcriptional regulator [Gammaproteobacteria bacterium]